MLMLLVVVALVGDCSIVVDDCVDKSRDGRLACFDRLVAEHCTVEAAAERGVEQFGSPASETKPASAPNEILDVIGTLSATGSRRTVVLQDTGQIWRQVDSKPLSLKPGDAVRIRKGFGGSYYLAKQSGSRSIKVRRVE